MPTTVALLYAIFAISAPSSSPRAAQKSVDSLILLMDQFSKAREEEIGAKQNLAQKLLDTSMITEDEVNADPVDPLDPGNPDPFPDPTDDPLDSIIPNFSYSVSRNGVAEKIALEVLYQTLHFYGVAHIARKDGSQVEFKVIASKSGYFRDLTKLDVAYAIREFSRYFTALLCNQVTYQAVYQAFAQVPAEEIGLRFKYDMAWALLGNSLPKEPNAIFALGTRWKVLGQVLGSSAELVEDSAESRKEIKSWIASMTDIVSLLQKLNRLTCYVNIRPDPKEELKKRIVITKILKMGAQLIARYDPLRAVINEVEKAGQKAQIESLISPAN